MIYDYVIAISHSNAHNQTLQKAQQMCMPKWCYAYHWKSHLKTDWSRCYFWVNAESQQCCPQVNIISTRCRTLLQVLTWDYDEWGVKYLVPLQVVICHPNCFKLIINMWCCNKDAINSQIALSISMFKYFMNMYVCMADSF